MENLSNNELAETFRDAFAEVERRIEASDHPHKGKLLILFKGAHALLERAAERLVDSDDVSANSVGGDKP